MADQPLRLYWIETSLGGDAWYEQPGSKTYHPDVVQKHLEYCVRKRDVTAETIAVAGLEPPKYRVCSVEVTVNDTV